MGWTLSSLFDLKFGSQDLGRLAVLDLERPSLKWPAGCSASAFDAGSVAGVMIGEEASLGEDAPGKESLVSKSPIESKDGISKEPKEGSRGSSLLSDGELRGSGGRLVKEDVD